jgi:hypothetical protein
MNKQQNHKKKPACQPAPSAAATDAEVAAAGMHKEQAAANSTADG